MIRPGEIDGERLTVQVQPLRFGGFGAIDGAAEGGNKFAGIFQQAMGNPQRFPPEFPQPDEHLGIVVSLGALKMVGTIIEQPHPDI